MRHPIVCLVAIAALVSVESKPSSAQTETVLYNFCTQTDCVDGGIPASGVIFGPGGALYGSTTYGGASGAGTVYKLTPGTLWTENVLYSFKTKGTGESPWANVLLDSSGAIYGVTSYFNGKFTGAVFKLTPPVKVGKPWTEKVLYKGGPHGNGFYGNLIADTTGALYGTTSVGGGVKKVCGKPGCGTVFKLTPPVSGAKWTETPILRFKATDGAVPVAGLIADSTGNLFGTTNGGGCDGEDECDGTVFELSPPAVAGGDWTESVLHTFTSSPDGRGPAAPLLADAAGNLYGTTLFGGTGTCDGGCGTVFKLTRPAVPGGAWTETIIYNFNGGTDGYIPSSGALIADATGALYGTTYLGGNNENCASDTGCGTAYKLTPPATPGGAWTETVLYRFCSQTGCIDGDGPYAGLTADSAGNLYGTTESGGAFSGGTIFKVTGAGFVP